MTKEEWQKLYIQLDSIYSDIISHYKVVENGKNKKGVNVARKEIDSAIYKTLAYIEGNREIYVLLTGDESNSSDARIFYFDEFKKSHYFKNYLTELVNKVRDKMDSY